MMLKRFGVLTFGLLIISSGCGMENDQAGSGDNNVGVAQQALELASNATGFAESFTTTGTIDRTNPFFAENPDPDGNPSAGNGRNCEYCHKSAQGWIIIPSVVTQLFKDTQGLDELFLTLDEGSRPDNDVSTLAARKKAFTSTLLKHAVTRFPLSVPDTAEFTVTAVKDPNGFSTISPQNLVIFRRSTPISNEAKVAQTNWAFQPSDFGATDVPSFLIPNAIGATGFHLQNPNLPVAAAIQIRDFSLGLFFAQTFDNAAGALDTDGAKGGPANLAVQPFYVGINDIQGHDPQGHAFTRKVFNIYDAWADADADSSLRGAAKKQAQARASIYRGQEIFNFFEFKISGVNGINDVLGQKVVRGTCSTCHNAPNVGGHSVIRFFDTGTADEGNCLSKDFPLLTLKNKTTGAVRKVCDPGRAGSGFPPSGHWVDVGAFRAPPLRGLVARAPFFHDAQAETIKDVIKFYNTRFNMNLTGESKQDLENFLSAL